MSLGEVHNARAVLSRFDVLSPATAAMFDRAANRQVKRRFAEPALDELFIAAKDRDIIPTVGDAEDRADRSDRSDRAATVLEPILASWSVRAANFPQGRVSFGLALRALLAAPSD